MNDQDKQIIMAAKLMKVEPDDIREAKVTDGWVTIITTEFKKHTVSTKWINRELKKAEQSAEPQPVTLEDVSAEPQPINLEDAAKSRDEIDQEKRIALGRLTIAQLRSIADGLDVHLRSKMRKADIIEKLVKVVDD